MTSTQILYNLHYLEVFLKTISTNFGPKSKNHLPKNTLSKGYKMATCRPSHSAVVFRIYMTSEEERITTEFTSATWQLPINNEGNRKYNEGMRFPAESPSIS